MIDGRSNLLGAAGLALGLWLAGAGAARGEAFLVRAGQPQADIVVAAAPPRMAAWAARELQAVLRRMTGAELPIVTVPGTDVPVHVYVGRSPATDALGLDDAGLEHGAYRVLSGTNWLALFGRDRDYVPVEPWGRGAGDAERVLKAWDAITGATWGNPMLGLHRQHHAKLGIWAQDERGSLNAVHDFLRGLGARWYFPGELGEILPRRADVALPAVDRTVRPDFPVRHLYFYYHEFFAAAEEEIAWQLRLNLQPHGTVMGRSLGHGITEVHSRPEIARAHPEYFQWKGGARQTEPHGGSPCLSAEGLFTQNVAYARALFDHYREPAVNVSPQDGYVSLCECERCRGRGTPQRGWDGMLSDYVWAYTDRVARELLKSHPDRWISGLAYTSYQLPPEHIEAFSPNLVVTLCRWRSDMADPARRERFQALANAWLDKLPSRRLFVWDYYLHARPKGPWAGIPAYFPHAAAADLRFLKGKSLGDFIEIYRNWPDDGLAGDALAANHLNCYVTARLYWDAEQDVDALLDEYYTLCYGPAAAAMKAVVDFAEASGSALPQDAAALDRLAALIGDARAAAGPDTVYARRVGLLADYTRPMKARRDTLARGRRGVPQALAFERPAGAPLDGRLDKPFWQDVPPYSLRDLQTGDQALPRTAFQVAWDGQALVWGIRCDEPDMAGLVVGGRTPDDPNAWNGDVVELMLESPVHAYYQIAVSPSGAVTDLDRQDGFNLRWASHAETAVHRGTTFWSLEVRVPVAGEQAAALDPLNGVAGEKPAGRARWYFNLGRQRIRGGQRQLAAFSFTPGTDAGFHETLRFGELMVP